MDFFSSAIDPRTLPVSSSSNVIDTATPGFAQAIESRFGGYGIVQARLSPTMTTMTPPPPPTNSKHTFTPTPASTLAPYLSDTHTLILDIRPHAAHTSARLAHSLSLCVPSTLLKRPLFSLSRLAQMLPTPTARARFSTWKTAHRILVYDADASSLPDTSNIAGLLKKFANDGFAGELCWLQGGFQAVWREQRHLVDTTQDGEVDADEEGGTVLRTRHLPMAAFSLSSTTIHAPKSSTDPAMNASNPFYDVIRQNIELSHGITDRIPLILPTRLTKRIDDLPFAWLRDIAKRATRAPHEEGASTDENEEALAMQFYKIELAEQRRLMGVMQHHSRDGADDMPFPFSITAGIEKGAKNRYKHIWPFEHARVRLLHHPDDYINASYIQPLCTTRRYIATQGPLPSTFADFWTLVWEQNVRVIVMLTKEVEGAMVKCGSYWVEDEGGGGTRGDVGVKLVKTEGLMPDEEDQQEKTKSAGLGFFQDVPPRSARPYAHTVSHPTPMTAVPQPTHAVQRSSTVKRTFELTNTRYPHAGTRRVVHLQYLEWPDMNVPDDARGVIGLVRRVEEAVEETDGQGHGEVGMTTFEGSEGSVKGVHPKTGVSLQALGLDNEVEKGKGWTPPPPPVLLHCSAGVGRTGGFIAVDAVLEAVRREMREGVDGMDVDVPSIKVEDDMGMQIDQPAPRLTGTSGSSHTHSATSATSTISATSSKVDSTTLAQHDRDEDALRVRERSEAGLEPVGSRFDERMEGMDRWVEGVRVEEGVERRMEELKTRSPRKVVERMDSGSGSGSGSGLASASGSGSGSGSSTGFDRVFGEALAGSRSGSGMRMRAGMSMSSSSLGTSVSPPPRSSSSASASPSPEGCVPDVDGRAKNAEPASVSSRPSLPSMTTSSTSSASFPLLPPSSSGSAPMPTTTNDLLQIVLQQQLLAEQRRMAMLSTPLDRNVPFKLGRPPSLGMGVARRSSLRANAKARSPPKTILSSEGEGEAELEGGGGSSSRSLSPEGDGVGVSGLSGLARRPSASASVKSTPERKAMMKLNLDQPKMKSPFGPGAHASASSSSHALPPTNVSTNPPTVPLDPSPSLKSFDYKEPRRLHTSAPPRALSTLHDPIWEVLKDMREQRMSLCQSLRQYVFVHKAILEGALGVVDEEREIREGLGRRRWAVGGRRGVGVGNLKEDKGQEREQEQERQRERERERQKEEDDKYEVGYWGDSLGPGVPMQNGVNSVQMPMPMPGGGGGGAYGEHGRASPTPSSSGRSSRSRSTSRGSRRHAPYGNGASSAGAGAGNNNASASFGAAAGASGGGGGGGGTRKRSNSPTELALLKDDREGGAMALALAAKRPSIKRKQRSGTGEDVQGHGSGAKRYAPVSSRAVGVGGGEGR